MNKIAGSIAFGFFGMLHPRMLWLMIWPMLIAIAIWGTAVVIFWTQAVVWIAGFFRQWFETAAVYFSWDAGMIALFAAKAIVVLLLLPLVYLTALLILSVFGLPAMVEHVAVRRFPELARRRGGSLAGSLLNSLAALAGMALLGLASIPFWLVPPLWPLIPAAVMGWVNQKVLRYDALAEHATADERRAIFCASRKTLYGLGVALAFLAYVPVLGFFAPVVFGLAFVHYLLGELKALREAPIEGQVTGA